MDSLGRYLYPYYAIKRFDLGRHFYVAYRDGQQLPDTLAVPAHPGLDRTFPAVLGTSSTGGRIFTGISAAPFASVLDVCPSSCRPFSRFTLAQTDASGIWVERWPPAGEGDRRYYDVFDRAASFRGAVVLSAPLLRSSSHRFDSPPWFTDRAVCGVVRAPETGVERVVKFALGRSIEELGKVSSNEGNSSPP